MRLQPGFGQALELCDLAEAPHKTRQLAGKIPLAGADSGSAHELDTTEPAWGRQRESDCRRGLHGQRAVSVHHDRHGVAELTGELAPAVELPPGEEVLALVVA